MSQVGKALCFVWTKSPDSIIYWIDQLILGGETLASITITQCPKDGIHLSVHWERG